MAWCWYIAGAYATLCLLVHVWRKAINRLDVKDKHVMVTGGSEGLGLAVASQLASMGARVSLVSRSAHKLEMAKSQVRAAGTNQSGDRVTVHPCDVTDFDGVKSAVAAANTAHGRPTDFVVCCAGLATPGWFIEQDISIFRQMMDVNYFGTVHTLKAALPAMIEADNHGHLVLVSSAASLAAFVGYTQYAASKYAVRGLADALRNEVIAYGMKVTHFMPSNIQTKGFENENKTKPQECKDIEGSADMFTAEKCSASLVTGLRNGDYAIANEALIDILRVGTGGVTPRTNVWLEVVVAPLAVVVGWGFRWWTDYVVSKGKGSKKSK